MNKRCEAAAESAAQEAKNDPMSLQGMRAALREALAQLDGDTTKTMTAQYAGRVTLKDKRRGSIGVFVHVDAKGAK